MKRRTKRIAGNERLAGSEAAPDAFQIDPEQCARSRDYSAILALHGTGGVTPGYDPKTTALAVT